MSSEELEKRSVSETKHGFMMVVFVALIWCCVEWYYVVKDDLKGWSVYITDAALPVLEKLFKDFERKGHHNDPLFERVCEIIMDTLSDVQSQVYEQIEEELKGETK